MTTPSPILQELDGILELIEGGPSGTAPLRTQNSFNTRTGAETTIDRISATSVSVGLGASGSMRLTYFTALRDLTAGSVWIKAGNTAAGATPTLIRVGVYSIAGDGSGTLVASTPNDTALLAASLTAYTKALSAPIALSLGQRYAVGLLVVSAATMPNTVGAALDNAACGRPPRMTGVVSGQTDLPASFAAGSVADSGSCLYAELVAV